MGEKTAQSGTVLGERAGSNRLTHIYGVLSLLLTTVLGIVGFLFVSDRFEFTDNSVEQYELEDNRTFEELSMQLASVQAALDQLGDVSLAPSGLPPQEFISGLAASEDADRLFGNNTFLWYDNQGVERNSTPHTVVGLFRHEQSGRCLWPSSDRTVIETIPCEQARAEILGTARDPYPVYRGWILSESGQTDLFGEQQDKWLLCFSDDVTPDAFDPFRSEQLCPSQIDGSVAGAPVSLSLRDTVRSHWSVATAPNGSGNVVLWAWGDDLTARCLGLDPSGVVGTFVDNCQEQDFSIELIQYLYFRSSG